MKQLQFYKYATWGLLLLNVAIVAFFFFRKPPPHHQSNRPNRAIDILSLDQDQHRLFLASANAHELRMDAIRSQQRSLLLPYFQSITTASATVDQEGVLNEVQTLERAKITSTYQHFGEIKAILGTGKDQEFKIFIETILDRVLIKPKKAPHPKGKHRNN